MPRILTITLNPAVDKSSSIDHVIAECKLRCTAPKFEPGGGGINVSRAVRKLGGISTALYLSGGPSGQILADLLEAEDIELHRVHISEWTRENLIIFEEATGLQYRFGMPGPTVRPEEWNQVLEIIKALDPPPDFIVTSGSVPPGIPDDIYARIARIAKELNSRLVVDTSGAFLLRTVQESVFLLKPNIAELAVIEGRNIEDEAHLEAAVLRLIEGGRCQIVVVSLGAGGALMATADQYVRVPAPTVNIQSKVGAGDSMVAGLVLALSRGSSAAEATRFAVAAGTAAVMTPGTELCRREDAERLYRFLQEKAQE